MKTLWFLFFFMIGLLATAHIEPPKTLREKAAMEVKAAKMAAQHIKFCRITDQGQAAGDLSGLVISFDMKGRETAYTTMDKKGNLISQTALIYDEAGNLILDADRNESGQLLEMDLFAFDDEGLIWGIESYDSLWQLSGRLRYEARPETAEVLVRKADKDNQLIYTISYFYDDGLEDGNCVEIIQNDAAGSLKQRVEQEFDADGIRLAKHVFDADNNHVFSYIYEYTALGDFSVIRKIDPQGKLMRTDHFLYNAENLIEQQSSTDEKGSIIVEKKYVYERY